MKEQTISAVLEDPKRGIDWPVLITYEFDGGIQINSVYDDHEMGDTDFTDELTPDQHAQVEMACIDDYESLDITIESRIRKIADAAKERAEWLAKAKRDR